jgi:hypothetical protein
LARRVEFKPFCIRINIVSFKMKKHTCKNKCQNTSNKKFPSWLPALFIAIIPKCPFCIMAYSGAFTLCSGTKMYPHTDATFSYISTGLAVFVILSILFNYKGNKTKYALFFTSIGMLLLLMSQFYWISENLYYAGVGFLFFGIWYNGSFSFFYQKYMARFKQYTTKLIN